jgi:subtilisin family serine protease
VAVVESHDVATWREVSRWPTAEQRAWEPVRYTSSLDRRQTWTPEGALDLLERAQAGGDSLLLAFGPGGNAEELASLPGLRVVRRHAFGTVAVELSGPANLTLARELIALRGLDVLAIDDRFRAGGGEAVTPSALASLDAEAAPLEAPTASNAEDPVANDTLYASQWNLWGGPRESPGPYGEALTPTSPGGANVPAAWTRFTDAREVIVAVIDTGADSEHADLAANLLSGVRTGLGGQVQAVPNSEDPGTHGTMVSGVIAAVGNNGLGTSGVCWRASVLPIRAEVEGELRLSAIVDAIYHAVFQGTRVINMSFGAESSNYLLFRALRFAHDQKALLVASAGNDGVDLDASPRYPASYGFPNLLTVAALDRDGELAEFSNYGSGTVDLAAPGVGIWTTFPGQRVARVDGTSFSAPMVAGAAALIWAKHADRGPRFVRERLLDYARQPEALRGFVQGRRQLDVGRSVRPRHGKRR